jgi:hypothetical protein
VCSAPRCQEIHNLFGEERVAFRLFRHQTYESLRQSIDAKPGLDNTFDVASGQGFQAELADCHPSTTKPTL